MSLEDALKENTAAVIKLTTQIAMSSLNNNTAGPAKSVADKLDKAEAVVNAPAKTDGAAAIAKAKAAKEAKNAKEAPAAEAVSTFPDYAKVRELVMEVAAPDKANRRDLVLEVLATYEVKQAQELKPEQREGFMKDLQAKLDEALAGTSLA